MYVARLAHYTTTTEGEFASCEEDPVCCSGWPCSSLHVFDFRSAVDCLWQWIPLLGPMRILHLLWPLHKIHPCYASRLTHSCDGLRQTDRNSPQQSPAIDPPMAVTADPPRPCAPITRSAYELHAPIAASASLVEIVGDPLTAIACFDGAAFRPVTGRASELPA